MSLEWTKDLSVGNEKIDSQHQYIFSLGRNISQINLDEAKVTIMELYKYTRDHFSAEEKHMASVGYSGLSDHKKIHAELIDGLNKTVHNQLSSNGNVVEFKKFFAHWIINHIMVEDMKYSELGKSK